VKEYTGMDHAGTGGCALLDGLSYFWVVGTDRKYNTGDLRTMVVYEKLHVISQKNKSECRYGESNRAFRLYCVMTGLHGWHLEYFEYF
jgi:hypothetical protein